VPETEQMQPMGAQLLDGLNAASLVDRFGEAERIEQHNCDLYLFTAERDEQRRALTRKIAAQEAELARPEGGREEAEAAETSLINFVNGEIAVVQNELAELKAREDKDALDFSAAPAGIEDLVHGLQCSRNDSPDGSMAAGATNAMLARGATELAQADMIAAMGEAGTDGGKDFEVYPPWPEGHRLRMLGQVPRKCGIRRMWSRLFWQSIGNLVSRGSFVVLR
jgi:hypothetical protein